MSNVFSGCHQSHGQDVDISVIDGLNHGSGGGGVVMSKFAGQIHCQMTRAGMTKACKSFFREKALASWKDTSYCGANRERVRRIKRRQAALLKMFNFSKRFQSGDTQLLKISFI